MSVFARANIYNFQSMRCDCDVAGVVIGQFLFQRIIHQRVQEFVHPIFINGHPTTQRIA